MTSVSVSQTAALTVAAFCKAYGVGRTFAYRQIKEGRLVARKAGTKTLIERDQAEQWLRSLPKLARQHAQR
jgi:excisionase family DNA binding protein